MKKICAFLAVVLSLAFAGITLAQDKPAAQAATPAAGIATAEAAKPKVDKGDTTWMMVATALVILMTIPGLALFYGGMVRSKNTLSVLMQVFVTFSLIAVVWVVYGYSITFSGGNAFIGGLSKTFLAGVTDDPLAATFSKGVAIPEIAFVAFQLTFAAITCALIVGSFAERIRFSAALVFAVLWFTFAYAPIAHMVWYWDGPDAITGQKSLGAVTAVLFDSSMSCAISVRRSTRCERANTRGSRASSAASSRDRSTHCFRAKRTSPWKAGKP